jgi:hypothetical protein
VKIKVEITVDVDPGKWMAEYGCEMSEVREDVRSYIRGNVQDSPAGEVGIVTLVRG